jgi:misacylated tRNA(Ala) deacylase
VTELAYLVDPPAAYVRTFRASVVALPPGGVVLDRTFFYPTGGGQPSDRGSLRGGGEDLEVVDVTKSGSSVIHRVRGSAGALGAAGVGATVEGTIDWDRRFRHMRLHTGQHLLSARIFGRTKLRTRRATMAGREAVLDLEAPIAEELLDPLIEDLRAAVEAPRPVSIRYVPRAEWDRHPAAGRAGLVPLPPVVDPVRVVEIDATDVCPCGGTHLRSTAELGGIGLRRERGGERVVLTLAEAAAPIPPP